VAFLGAVDHRCRPYRFAGTGQWGVAPLDIEMLAQRVRDLRSRNDIQHVVVSLHWGEERFLFPAPGQVEQAHALVDAGASLVLGHHPHVLQGMETYRDAPIIYSLAISWLTKSPFPTATWCAGTGRSGPVASCWPNWQPNAVRDVCCCPPTTMGVVRSWTIPGSAGAESTRLGGRYRGA